MALRALLRDRPVDTDELLRQGDLRPVQPTFPRDQASTPSPKGIPEIQNQYHFVPRIGAGPETRAIRNTAISDTASPPAKRLIG